MPIQDPQTTVNSSPNSTSDYRNPLSEVKFEREVNAGILQAETIAQGNPRGNLQAISRQGWIRGEGLEPSGRGIPQNRQDRTNGENVGRLAGR